MALLDSDAMVGQPIADGGEVAKSEHQSTAQAIVERARSLDTRSDRVRLIHDVVNEGGIRNLEFSSMMFTAEVLSVAWLPPESRGSEMETSEVFVLLEEEVRFEGLGEGVVRFGITADGETNEIKRVNVSRQLSATSQREATTT
ncbi:hypothetical protein U3A55_09480 [Salarchaeum sp. III]|uniref:hypothetical protein n=1 Tax=Salarchaeum sp. III TaxID=3107927 RepID=UPI002EDB2FFD